VLATGGGAFMNPGTRQLILNRTIAVWLKADVELLVKRVARKADRPLLHGKDPTAVLEALARVREPVYALAHLTVDSVETPHGVTVQAILDALSQRLPEEPPA
jgi:shikimate kinase